MNSLSEQNTVELTGVIVEDGVFSHEVYGEGFYRFYIASERLSEQQDILPITISERLLTNQTIQRGVCVHVKGQLRSYNNYTQAKSKLVLTIFVRELEVISPEEVSNVNEITLHGFVCKPPVYRKTPFGREIADVLLAVNRAYGKSDYIPCIAWGRNARYISTFEVGTEVTLTGRVQSRTYTKKLEDTQEQRVAYEVSVARIAIEQHS